MLGQRRRLLDSLTLLLAISSFVLIACNSNSSSRQSGGTNTVTGAEAPMPSSSPSKETMAEALARQLKGGQ
jgi:hypothetical protein